MCGHAGHAAGATPLCTRYVIKTLRCLIAVLAAYATIHVGLRPTGIGVTGWSLEALSDDAHLTSVCLSVAYIGPMSRPERPRKTKIGTEVVHITRDSDTTFKVKRSKVNLQGATSVPILVFLALSVLDLGPMYATDRRQTDRRVTASLLNALAY